MTDADQDAEGGGARFRAFAGRIASRVGGVPAVRTLTAVLATYDRAGGGLVAGGLAYAGMVALLPGLLLMVAVFGLLTSDAATREQLVSVVATSVPPLEDFTRTALQQLSGGAVPTTVIGLVGLVWGASRFYSALDDTLARIFDGSRKRNEIERTLRGVALTMLLVVVPLAALLLGSLAGWIAGLLTPDGTGGAILQAVTLLGPFALFVAATILVYRFVPAVHVPSAAFLRPAIIAGVALAVIAQLFTVVAPFLTRIAAVFGPFVAVFALLAWLSVSFNVLLLGASWSHVRALAIAAREADTGEATTRPGVVGMGPANGTAEPGERRG